MKVRVHNVVVTRDEITRIPKKVWAWELPVLQAKFPGGNVALVSEEEIELAELPKANEEYDRLKEAYGVEEETKRSFTELAFGWGGDGVSKLEDSIRASAAGARRKRRAAEQDKEPEPADPLAG